MSVLTALFTGLSHHKNLHVESSLLWHATNKFYLMGTEFGVKLFRGRGNHQLPAEQIQKPLPTI